MSMQFNIVTPTAIHFGPGASKALISALPERAKPVLLVRGASETASGSVRQELEQQGIVVHQVSVRSEPSVASVNAAFAQMAGQPCAAIIACGGGSVLDTAKALRFCIETGTEIPQDFSQIDQDLLDTEGRVLLIAIPTTAGTGADVTSNAVLGTQTAKVSLRGRRLFPSVSFVDPCLMATAPKSVAVGAGLDAVTQVIEAYTSRLASPFTDAITAPNVRLGAETLRSLAQGGDPDLWAQMAWVSLSSGMALANGGLGAAHGLAAVIGGATDAPHGPLCGRLLGPVLIANRKLAEPGSLAARKIAYCIETLADVFPPDHLGPDHLDPDLSGFDAWLAQHNIARLRDYCPDRAGFDAIAEAAVSASSSTKNAVPLRKEEFQEILNAAY